MNRPDVVLAYERKLTIDKKALKTKKKLRAISLSVKIGKSHILSFKTSYFRWPISDVLFLAILFIHQLKRTKT